MRGWRSWRSWTCRSAGWGSRWAAPFRPDFFLAALGLGDAAQSRAPCWNGLHCGGADRRGHGQACEALASGLERSPGALRRLWLNDNPLGGGVSMLAPLVRHQDGMRQLGLRNVGLGDAGTAPHPLPIHCAPLSCAAAPHRMRTSVVAMRPECCDLLAARIPPRRGGGAGPRAAAGVQPGAAGPVGQQPHAAGAVRCRALGPGPA